MGSATIAAGNPATAYEEQRRAEEAGGLPARTEVRRTGRLRWRARCSSNHFSDHLQLGGPLACRHEDGGRKVLYLGYYGLYGYANTKTLAGPFETLDEAKNIAADIVVRAKLRRLEPEGRAGA
jgi:hypothetical protein